jgi:hypothetical protein
MKRRVIASAESTLMHNPVDYLPHQLQEENAGNLGSSSSPHSKKVLCEERVGTPARKLRKINIGKGTSSTFASSCWETIGIESDLDIPENHDYDNLLSPFKQEAELDDFPLDPGQDFLYVDDDDEFFMLIFNEMQESLDKEQDNEGHDIQDIRQNERQDKKQNSFLFFETKAKDKKQEQERKTEKKAKRKGETETRQGGKQGQRPGRMGWSRKPVSHQVPEYIVHNANAPIQNAQNKASSNVVPYVDTRNSKMENIARVPILLDGYAIPDRFPTTCQYPQNIR